MSIPVEIVGEGIDWPAWVQAIGSVLALLAIFLAQRNDHREAEKIRTRESFEARQKLARASLTAAKFVVASVAAAVRTQAESFEKGWSIPILAMSRVDLAAALDSLRGIDRGALPNEGAVIAVVNLMQAAHATDRLLENLEQTVSEGKVPKETPLASVLSGAEASLGQLRDHWIDSGIEYI